MALRKKLQQSQPVLFGVLKRSVGAEGERGARARELVDARREAGRCRGARVGAPRR